MQQTIIDFISSLGYVGIALLMCLEMVVPFIPSEIIMSFAGFSAASGDLSLTGVIIAGTVGSVAGAVIIYALARLIKDEKVYSFIDKYGRWTGITSQDLRKANDWFSRHAHLSVLVGRIIPGARSVVSIPAGIAKMPIRTFLLFTVIGSAIWTAILGVAGFFIGDNYQQISHIISYITTAIVVGAVIALGVFIWRRKNK